MSMNKTWAISSWISFLISMGILAGALRLHEFHNCASFRLLSLSAMISQYFTRGGFCLICSPHGNDKKSPKHTSRRPISEFGDSLLAPRFKLCAHFRDLVHPLFVIVE